jgi:hypothetical protein
MSSLLHEAREKAYTRQNILSAFEAMGISPFDAYLTDVMREFRDRARFAHLAQATGPLAAPLSQAPTGRPPPNPQHNNRSDVIQRCRELAQDTSTSPSSLRSALINALAALEGAKARIVTLESGLAQVYEANRVREAAKPRGSRVGRA